MELSVICATKNEQSNLERLLSSLKKQSFGDFEMIVIDNFSKDQTRKIAQNYTKLVFQKGPERTVQRNFGLTKAKGKYVLFVDADMQLEPTVLEECSNLMDRNPKLAGIVIDEISKGSTFLSKVKALEKQLATGEETIEAARFFRKKDLLKIGGYDEKLISGEDWDLSQRMAKFGPFGRIKSKIYHFENQSIWQDIKKKYYYAKNIGPYIRKYPKLWKSHQANFRNRLKILFKKPDLILKHPLEFLGLLFLKSAHFAAFIAAKYL
ncbi:glycosyltransferase [Candidatus Curtissbacteria bacterium]|nr:glycosyltransferase [Candidatus Curtissbacteria bacterium]